MKKITLTIENCQECPNFEYDDDDYGYCHELNKKVENFDIDKDCPLENV